MKMLNIACLAILCTASACVADAPGQGTQNEPAIPVTQEVAFQPAAGTAEKMDVYKVKFETSKGDFVVEVHPEWAPLGAEQFKKAVEAGVYNDARFFRVVDGFMVQFGIPGDPAMAKEWREKKVKDDPKGQSNQRGMMTFAMAGPNTRTSQVFINFGDNAFLDNQGFPPFAKVVEGMDVVDSLYKEYGEGAPRGRGPDQGRIQMEGNAYLTKSFPKMDYIKTATVVK
ncbi:peptidylprolyl isomerase [Planctomicrobium piriforme]|uniref:Peptidyl-prolyl cis-trans isomerase n=1 Tax=Planctomicrobium piriforme TaxID=1576369 RepID=A0A1I3K7S8_9PLAN|nr:peptidylprolyl isomerase [Planctomicrobium piriforme]SFI68235.1 Peptidyl-prolyl cis-trans isomerase (rotamase)-cyclophilin family [Planctomicrobium piriforme]